MTNQIIISDISIRKDAQGRYSLNDLHQASGSEQRHRPKYWLELQQTCDLIDEILKGVIPPFNHEGNSNSAKSQSWKPVATKSGRYGGTYVCKELVYAYAMWISAAFALKVIRAYDALVSGNVEVKPKVRQCTATQLTPLRQTAERLITTGLGKIYPDIWKLVHQRFDVEHIHQLQPEQVGEAIEYLNVLEGEYLGKATAPAAHQKRYNFPAETADPHDRKFGNAWMTPRVILDERNRAPELELLDALQRDGYDITGAQIRIHAMYNIVKQFIEMQKELAEASRYMSAVNDIIKNQTVQRGSNVSFTGKEKGMAYGGYCKRTLPRG